MPGYVRRGVIKRYRRRKGARHVAMIKKGYNYSSLPRAFPTSEMVQRFSSTQSKIMAGHVNDASHWQFLRFNGVLDGAQDFGFFANTATDGNGVGSRIVTHSYRNFDLVSGFYDRMFTSGCTMTLDFTQQIVSTSVDLANYNIYVWMQANDSNSQDITQPLALASTGTGVAVSDVVDTVAKTDATFQALEMSRRVLKFRSYRQGSTVKARITFRIPNGFTRRGYKLNVHKKAQVAGTGGNGNAPSATIAGALSSVTGFNNQVNVLIIAETNNTAAANASKFMTHVRITKSFVGHFYERNETAN